ncbi:MAG TPA: hypothetical protein VGD79_10640 [Thermoanaerobaculia bacterium]
MRQASRADAVRASVLILWAVLAAGGADAQIKIDSPAKNAVIATPLVYASGTLVAANRNVGVTVNDVPAILDLEHAGTKNDPFRWSAALQPEPGKVKLKARIHMPGKPGSDDGEGASVVHIDFAPRPSRLILTPVRASGITPFDVTFSAGIDNPADVVRFEIDFDGNGTWDQTAATMPDKLTNRYATPGIRLAAARVTLRDGSTASATTIVHAQTFKTTNALLKQVWAGFRQSLASGNVEAVMPWFAADSVRDKYRRPLETIRASLLSFAAGIQTLDAIWIRNDAAHYLATRVENGRPTGYHVYFTRDATGLWKVLQF